MEMTPENWNKVKALFDSVLTLEPSERASFLARNCPDDGLRQEVEKLVVNYSEAGQFLSDPALSPGIATACPIPGVHSADESADFKAGSRVLVATTPSPEEDVNAGRRLGVYKLVRRVGQGGMAGVYLAVRADGEFRQQVAIKLVRVGLDSDEVLSRFRNERQTLALLDHPNIVKLLDGGSSPEGTPYLVMDYVEGSPIDEYCARHKLSVEERLHLFGKVCQAVEYAHQEGVIHRDLKPSNILVTADGVPKLLDFGIAKVLSAQSVDEALRLTHTGARCMTPAYASPEQIRGKSPTVATDIYSLGVVLYELLTGHRPYRLKENTPVEIERAICEQEPEAPSTAVNRLEGETSTDGTTPELVSQTREGQQDKLRRRLRGDLDTILLKPLQKEPERRYGSVAELAGDIDRHLRHLPVKARRSTLRYRSSKLVRRYKIEVGAALFVMLALGGATSFAFNAWGLRDRLARAPSYTRIQSLAVIPFANNSADGAQEYFSDGMTDGLITNLAEIGSLRVISRTSSMQYKQTKKALPEIARELSVDGIVAGTVQRSGDHLRITAQLISAASEKPMWANSYERNLGDVFTLEREIAGDIARQVQAKVTTAKQLQLAQPRPVNPRALEAYLRGNSHMHRFSRGFGDEELRLASEYFSQAIEAEPDFAAAYVGMSRAREGTLRSSSEDEDIGRKAAQRAVELDPNLSDAWTALADVRCDFWDWSEAEQDYRRALALNPNDGDAHEHLGWLLDALGRLDEGWREAEIAQQLDPHDDHLEPALDTRREYDQIIQHITAMLEADPNNGVLHYKLFEGYQGKAMYKEAVEQLEQTLVLFGLQESAAKLHQAFDSSGYKGAMREWAKELEYLHASNQVFLPINLASAYTAAGDKDRAFYWLEQAYSRRGYGGAGVSMVFLNREPSLEPLHSDPRYKDLLRRVGLPP